jgi:hypothetical protein
MTIQVDFRQVTLKTDKLIYVDGWKFGVRLLESDWEKAQFRIPSQTGCKPAVNITVTGRTVQRKNDTYVARIKIEFVGDDEPSTFHAGWIELD